MGAPPRNRRTLLSETAGGKIEVVRALDRATGGELWRASWPGDGSVPFFAAANGDWIRATPAFDGKSLFVGGMNELLVALDAETGAERWRVDLPARYGTQVPDFGYVSSPLVDGDHLYAQAANSLIKLDKRTGETVWRALAFDGSIMNSGAFSSPVLAEIRGRRQLVVQTREALFVCASSRGSPPSAGAASPPRSPDPSRRRAARLRRTVLDCSRRPAGHQIPASAVSVSPSRGTARDPGGSC